MPAYHPKDQMSDRLTIRPALPADIASIRRIAMLTWPHAYADILSEKQVSYMLQMMYNAETLQRQMEEEGHLFLLAESDGEAIGFAGFSPYEGSTWKLHKLYVMPFHQQTGAGRTLLQTAEHLAKDRGATAMILNVNRNNRAVQFYIRRGYQIDHEGDFDIGQGFYMNDYVMRKTL
jgi:GNAT superfamily N-acetyltransferase